MKFARFTTLLMIVAMLAVACTDVVIHVGRKSKTANFDAAAAGLSEQDLNIYDFESYLRGLDNVRNISSDRLLSKIDSNWRQLFRREFRKVRDSIIATGDKDHSYELGIQDDVNTEDCSQLDRLDLSSIESLDSLSSLLEGALLANLSGEHAKLINPDLASSMDNTSRLILFELGMQGDGWSKFEQVDGEDRYSSFIKWRVNPEVQDSPEHQANDHIDVRIRFDRILKGNKAISLDLIIEAGEGLYVDDLKGPLYRLEIQSHWQEDAIRGLVLDNRFLVKKDQDIKYSRRFYVQQSSRIDQRFLYQDTIHFEQPEESSKEVILDFQSLQKCALENTQIQVPGVVGMSEDDAKTVLELTSFRSNVVEDRSNGASTAVVIAQKPKAGESAPAGSDVQLILDLPPKDPFAN